MDKPGTGLEHLFRLAYSHFNLILGLDKDPLLNPENSVYEPYDASDFDEVEGVKAKGVSASWYADEKKGARFQGRLTPTSYQFNTYEFTAAINQNLIVRQGFRLGDYVKVIYRSTDSIGNEFQKETIVLITDIKGNPGIDLSKAAAKMINLKHNGKAPVVDLILLRPKDCQKGIETNSIHPMATCYSRNVYIEENVSSVVPARFNRATVLPFLRRHWEWAYIFKFFNMNKGIARPAVKAEFIPVRDVKKVRLVSRVGPFQDKEAARAYLNKYCRQRHPEGAQRQTCAFSEKIKIHEWARSARAIKFHGKPQSETAVSYSKPASKMIIASTKDKRK